MFVFVKSALYISEKLEFMKKEEIYLDLTKLTSDELKQVAESVKNEMFIGAYRDLSNGITDDSFCLIFEGEWFRDNFGGSRKEITYDEFLINFGKMTETEKKLYDYAVKVNWDFYAIKEYIANPNIGLTFKEYKSLEGFMEDKATNFIEKYKPKDPVMITLPIDDYNRLRKLEIKQEIKRLKRELKGL